jgi:hypothetical protein
MIQSAGQLPGNNHPEDTPPNPLNTTFNYNSLKETVMKLDFHKELDFSHLKSSRWVSY